MAIIVTWNKREYVLNLLESLHKIEYPQESLDIVVVDNLLTGHQENLPIGSKKNLTFIKEDVNNIKEISDIFARYNFDYVFHYAAIVGVQRTLANPILVLNDIVGLKNIMSLSKNTGVKRVFFSSSSEGLMALKRTCMPFFSSCSEVTSMG